MQDHGATLTNLNKSTTHVVGHRGIGCEELKRRVNKAFPSHPIAQPSSSHMPQPEVPACPAQLPGLAGISFVDKAWHSDSLRRGRKEEEGSYVLHAVAELRKAWQGIQARSQQPQGSSARPTPIAPAASTQPVPPPASLAVTSPRPPPVATESERLRWRSPSQWYILPRAEEVGYMTLMMAESCRVSHGMGSEVQEQQARHPSGFCSIHWSPLLEVTPEVCASTAVAQHVRKTCWLVL